MKDSECVAFLQWALPQLRMRWPGFRQVRRQVCKRIDRRMRELGLANAAAYRAYLAKHPTEWNALDGFCRISISRFYRDRGVFDFLRREVLPELAAGMQAGMDRVLRCWSAGCASGEEVYTLRIAWELDVGRHFPDVSMRILATDSDPRMLDRALLGCYSMSSLKDLPPEWLSKACTESDGLHCVRPEFREGIEFALQDIRRHMPAGQFQLVLCRHAAPT